MSDTGKPESVRITQDLRDALYDYADVTFSIAADSSNGLDHRLAGAMRGIWSALWDLGADGPKGATGDTELPSYVSDPVSIVPGRWKITVDFAHVSREERVTAPEVIATVLRQHAATPVVLDSAHLTEAEFYFAKEASDPPPRGADPDAPQLSRFRRRA